MKVPFLDLSRGHLRLQEEIEQSIDNVVNSNKFILGQQLSDFETAFAKYCGVKYCIGVGNGLDALKICLLSLGVGPGDEVLVPSNTFIATWFAVSDVGAVPIPVEPNPNTHNIELDEIKKAITPKTRAVIPVHLYGQPAQIKEIVSFANSIGIFVVEDFAQAQGATYKGDRVGSFGHISATSFYPGKNLGAFGDGGAVVTSDPDLLYKAKMLRNYGSFEKYEHKKVGLNSRLDELQAAILNVKLKYLDDWNDERRNAAKLYGQLLNANGIDAPIEAYGCKSVWHLYVLKVEKREKLQSFLQERGISTIIHYPIPPHQQDCYSNVSFDGLELTENLSKRVLSLPMFPGITEEEIEYVVETILRFNF